MVFPTKHRAFCFQCSLKAIQWYSNFMKHLWKIYGFSLSWQISRLCQAHWTTLGALSSLRLQAWRCDDDIMAVCIWQNICIIYIYVIFVIYVLYICTIWNIYIYTYLYYIYYICNIYISVLYVICIYIYILFCTICNIIYVYTRMYMAMYNGDISNTPKYIYI